MTAFFIPGLETDGALAERAYGDLRETAEAETGSVAHKRRIQRLACRRQGTDCTIEVGDTGVVDGQTVVAILQLGRDAFTVICQDHDDPASPTTVAISRRAVYAVTDFDG